MTLKSIEADRLRIIRRSPVSNVNRDAKDRPNRTVPRRAILRRRVNEGSGDHKAEAIARIGKTRTNQVLLSIISARPEFKNSIVAIRYRPANIVRSEEHTSELQSR